MVGLNRSVVDSSSKIVNLNRSVVGSFTNTRLNDKLAQCFKFDFVCSCVPRFMNPLSAWIS
jgi:hypothetical protein